MLRYDVETLLAERFSPQRVRQILALARPAIEILPTPLAGDPAPCGSRFGGRPDLPAGVAWPMYGDVPLTFLAQFDLADLRSMPNAASLPQTGLLSFFAEYLLCQGCYGSEPGMWAVLYHDGSRENLVRLEPPPGPERITRAYGFETVIPPFALALREFLDIPCTSSAYLKGLGLSDEEGDLYFDIYYRALHGPGHPIIHKLLGHANIVQNDIEPGLFAEWQQAAETGAVAGEPHPPPFKPVEPGETSPEAIARVLMRDLLGYADELSFGGPWDANPVLANFKEAIKRMSKAERDQLARQLEEARRSAREGHPDAAAAMRLLFEMDSLQLPHYFGATWGDAGRLYFYIHKDDLAARRFERAMFDMQCT
ncbi:MAG: DUF1963 domain-containing protein [Pseudomonadota bacterium]